MKKTLTLPSVILAVKIISTGALLVWLFSVVKTIVAIAIQG
jgi:hypothetical protein